VKFFQLSPGEYLFQLKYIVLYRVTIFKSICDRSVNIFITWFNPKETKKLFYLLLSSLLLFGLGLAFLTTLSTSCFKLSKLYEEVLEPSGLLINILNLSWYYFTAPISFSNFNYSDFNWIIKYRITSNVSEI
jgi:hypothetical protein